MKATGTAAEIMEACERATIEHNKVLDYLAPKTARSRLRYIEQKTQWDLFRRSSEYWAGRWETSSRRDSVLQNNGTAYTLRKINVIEEIAERVDNLSSLDSFTVSDHEISTLSYIYKEDRLY